MMLANPAKLFQSTELCYKSLYLVTNEATTWNLELDKPDSECLKLNKAVRPLRISKMNHFTLKVSHENNHIGYHQILKRLLWKDECMKGATWNVCLFVADTFSNLLSQEVDSVDTSSWNWITRIPNSIDWNENFFRSSIKEDS